ncbi:hypothetical protein BZB76_2496 [Actinomadura pelletieri DSM 43383]|uniref:Uncharacterized protein n=1 Tax=Actinomadura pelletieri DSM 43383 TaxID=1120940 RepID=A0A495QUA1_9ACTN|nr:hypothetical protein BZB76_2496 [Actinomadura pelletieri DSM 43383]
MSAAELVLIIAIIVAFVTTLVLAIIMRRPR